MKTEGGREHFSLGFDLTMLEQSQAEAIALFEELTQKAQVEANKMSEALSSIGFDESGPAIGIKSTIEAAEKELEKILDILLEIEAAYTQLGESLKGDGSDEGALIIQGMEEALGQLTDRYFSLSESISAYKESMDEAAESTREATDATQEKTEANSQTVESEDELRAEIERMKAARKEETQATEESTKATKEDGESSEEVAEKKSFLTRVINKLKGSKEDLNKATKGSKKTMDQLADSLNPVDAAIGKLPSSIRSAVQNLVKMNAASASWIALGFGAAVAAAAVALEALSEWFSETKDGQYAMAEASSVLEGYSMALKKQFIGLGETIADTFGLTSQDDIDEFGDKTDSAFKKIIDGSTKAMSKLTDLLGIANYFGINFFSNLLADADPFSEAISVLNKGQLELREAETAWSVERAKLMKDRSIYLEDMYMSIDDATKQKAINNYSDVVDAIADEDIRLATIRRDKVLSWAEQYKEAGADAIKYTEMVNDAEVKLIQAEQRKYTLQTRVKRAEGAIARRQAAESKTRMQAAQRALDKYENAIDGLEHRAEQAQIKLNIDIAGEDDNKAEQLRLGLSYDLNEIEEVRRKFILEHGGITEEAEKAFKNWKNVLVAGYDFDIDSLANNMLKDFGSLEEKRQSIIDDHDKIIEAMESDPDRRFSQQNIDAVKAKRDDDLAAFDTEFQDKTKAAYRVFAIMVGKSRDELKILQNDAKELVDFLMVGEWDDSKGATLGLTQEQFNEIIGDPQQLAEFEHAYKKIKNVLFRLKDPIAQFKEGLLDLTKSTNKSAVDQLEAIKKIKEGWGTLASAISLVSSAFGGLAELVQDDVLGSIATGLSDIVDVGNEVMAGAETGAAFGSIGTIVGASLGLISSVTGKLAENKKHRRELKKQIEENERAEYFGQLEIEQIWRQKYNWAQKIGESTLYYLKRESEELQKQAKDNEKAQDKLWKKLMEQEHKVGEKRKSTGLFGWGKGKIVEEWDSLRGKTFEEVEEIAQKGNLSEEAKEVFEAFKASREEGEKLSDMMEESAENWREVFTGTSYDGLVTGIVNAFKEGKRSAEDFANSFEDLMQGAVLSAIQLMADEQFREWYEDFAEKGKDGYTEEEIEESKRDYIALMKNLDAQVAALEEVTSIYINDLQKQEGATIGAYEKVTQDQWNRTDGLLRGMHLLGIQNNENVKEIVGWAESINDMRNIALESWTELAAINKNTKLIARTNEVLEKLDRDGIKML